MPINFPDTPIVGQEFTVGNITWIWNGTSWNSKTSQPIENDELPNIFMLMGA